MEREREKQGERGREKQRVKGSEKISNSDEKKECNMKSVKGRDLYSRISSYPL